MIIGDLGIIKKGTYKHIDKIPAISCLQKIF